MWFRLLAVMRLNNLQVTRLIVTVDLEKLLKKVQRRKKKRMFGNRPLMWEHLRHIKISRQRKWNDVEVLNTFQNALKTKHHSPIFAYESRHLVLMAMPMVVGAVFEQAIPVGDDFPDKILYWAPTAKSLGRGPASTCFEPFKNIVGKPAFRHVVRLISRRSMIEQQIREAWLGDVRFVSSLYGTKMRW